MAFFSMTTVFAPSTAADAAAIMPAWPAPHTKMSASSVSTIWPSSMSGAAPGHSSPGAEAAASSAAAKETPAAPAPSPAKAEPAIKDLRYVEFGNTASGATVDLFRMRRFVNVAEHLNLTRAAEASGITQPAMSVQMRELERETGLHLLVRRKGRIALTDAGAALRDGFAGILGLYESALVKAQALTRAPGGVVHTGFHGSLTAFQPVYQGFRDLYPTLDVTIRVAEWQQLASMVASGELDVAFVETREAQARPELRQAPFLVERGYCVAASRTNPLADRGSVAPGDLSSETVLMSAYKPEGIGAMYRGLIASGVRRETIRRVEDVDCSIAMAAAGMGVAAMPRFLAMPGNPSVTWLPVEQNTFACELVMVWRPDNRSPHLQAFVDYCSEEKTTQRLERYWDAMLDA